MDHPWYEIGDAAEIPSPALLVFPRRIDFNLRKMLQIAGAPQRLRPHVKTHKMPAVVKRCIELGIEKFKCATIAEAEMLASCGARDVLLALQPVGPQAGRLWQLSRVFETATRFSTVVDDLDAARVLSDQFSGIGLGVWIDIDCGMHRTGVAPEAAPEFFREIQKLPGLRVLGLHAYDGHIHEPDLERRRELFERAMAPVRTLRRDLGLERLPLVAGGSPTFSFHAAAGDAECSPGTPVFWDAGYASQYPDLPFEIAAAILCRVIAKPGKNRLCLDLGYKAVASESPQPRFSLPEISGFQVVMHSEEHVVIETSEAGRFGVGDGLIAIPKHICPTCALYAEAAVIDEGRVTGTWKISARDRRIGI